jgi:hypothetical protein
MAERLGIGGHHSPRMEKDEWLTPPYILKALGGADSFDLDPCAPVNRPWPMAKAHYTTEENGLSLPWFGRVWLNPPYGPPVVLGPWLRRMVAHGHGTALIFARTETELFFDCVWKRANALLFLQGRLHFHHADGARAGNNAGGPSVLVAYGHDDARALHDSGLPGQFLLTDGSRWKS